ncbi:hypothetical protein U9M48_037333 [Paspalum notatum var. saurae]|uniref:Uncharacterized protein n=1 Tax=Paspalum notatum var. saurae TaxID=547442 RepID=A0AAQ3XAI1_PASNO
MDGLGALPRPFGPVSLLGCKAAPTPSSAMRMPGAPSRCCSSPPAEIPFVATPTSAPMSAAGLDAPPTVVEAVPPSATFSPLPALAVVYSRRRARGCAMPAAAPTSTPPPVGQHSFVAGVTKKVEHLLPPPIIRRKKILGSASYFYGWLESGLVRLDLWSQTPLSECLCQGKEHIGQFFTCPAIDTVFIQEEGTSYPFQSRHI